MSKQERRAAATCAGAGREVRFGRHPGGTAALMLDAARAKEGVAVATVGLADPRPLEGRAFLKDYAENDGVLRALRQTGINEDTGQRVQAGYASVAVCNLLIQPELKRRAARPHQNHNNERGHR